jgi:hypothetical protein
VEEAFASLRETHRLKVLPITPTPIRSPLAGAKGEGPGSKEYASRMP